ncbi:MAG: LuxR family transcriptional regulator [Chitinophagaceae bacterium]|nr:MAG: LuxR family transcriptional regulator [Chitinophagaceae bacterium]
MKAIEFNKTELAIIKMICKQQTAKEMADKLGLSFRTVEEYRGSIQKKVKARNLVGIALYAVKHDLVKV